MGLEKELLSPAVRSSALRLSERLADDFIEIGVSGRRYGKGEVIAALTNTRPLSIEAGGFSGRRLSDTLILVVYDSETTTEEPGWKETASRSSLWQLRNNTWQVIFHQGTGKKPE